MFKFLSAALASCVVSVLPICAVSAEGEEKVPETAGRIMFAIIETDPRLAGDADDALEVFIDAFTREKGVPFEIVGGGELRNVVAPDVEGDEKPEKSKKSKRGAPKNPRKKQNDALADCFGKPACLTGLMVRVEASYAGLGYLGARGKGGFRLKLVFYDSGGDKLADETIEGARGEEFYARMQGVIRKSLVAETASLEVKAPRGATVWVNGGNRGVGEQMLTFLRPGPYRIQVEMSPDFRPLERVVTLKRGDAVKVVVTEKDFVPLVSAEAKVLREQGKHYCELKPPNYEMARQTFREAIAKGGEHDAETLYRLALAEFALRHIAEALDAAERAFQTPNPDNAFAKAAREIYRKWNDTYGGVLFTKHERASSVGKIYLDTVTGLIAIEKKKMFEPLRDELARRPIDFAAEANKNGIRVYLPPGDYLANGVPFQVIPGKIAGPIAIVPDAARREDDEKKPGIPLSVWATGGAGALVLATGVALHVAAFGKADEYNTTRSQRVANAARNDGERFQMLALVSYGLGVAVIGGATVLYALTGEPKAASASGPAVSVLPMTDGFAARLAFQF